MSRKLLNQFWYDVLLVFSDVVVIGSIVFYSKCHFRVIRKCLEKLFAGTPSPFFLIFSSIEDVLFFLEFYIAPQALDLCALMLIKISERLTAAFGETREIYPTEYVQIAYYTVRLTSRSRRSEHVFKSISAKKLTLSAVEPARLRTRHTRHCVVETVVTP